MRANRRSSSQFMNKHRAGEDEIVSVDKSASPFEQPSELRQGFEPISKVRDGIDTKHRFKFLIIKRQSVIAICNLESGTVR